MDWLVNTVYYVVPFIVLLGILVFVHEFGHFIVARLTGVQVEAFSIGLGKMPREPPGKFRPFLWGGTVSFWVMPTLLPQRPTKRRKN